MKLAQAGFPLALLTRASRDSSMAEHTAVGFYWIPLENPVRTGSMCSTATVGLGVQQLTLFFPERKV